MPVSRTAPVDAPLVWDILRRRRAVCHGSPLPSLANETVRLRHDPASLVLAVRLDLLTTTSKLV